MDMFTCSATDRVFGLSVGVICVEVSTIRPFDETFF